MQNFFQQFGIFSTQCQNTLTVRVFKITSFIKYDEFINIRRVYL